MVRFYFSVSHTKQTGTVYCLCMSHGGMGVSAGSFEIGLQHVLLSGPFRRAPDFDNAVVSRSTLRSFTCAPRYTQYKKVKYYSKAWGGKKLSKKHANTRNKYR